MKTLRFTVITLALCLCASGIFAQQTSAPVVFSVTDPVLVPTIGTTTPASTSAGSPQFTITVNGTNFQSNSIVQWTPTATGSATTQLVTTFVSATKLTAVVPATLVASKTTVNITVLNPIIVSQHQVDLQWTASVSGGVSGYAVYRGTNHGGPYTKVIQKVVGTSTTDPNVQNGTTYYYVLTSVDSAGKESVFSAEAVAVIPA